MAQSVHLTLEANGTKIDGDSTIESNDRADTIECLFFKDSVRTAIDASSGMATGRRSYEPITIRKRIDKSSPLLAKALCENHPIKGIFKFYRPNPADSSTQYFFTVEIDEGRISAIVRTSPDTIDPAADSAPPTEEVSFVFANITWTYEDGGISHTDEWKKRQ
jgi:type VI secretion system secreted protein Hcp